MQLMAARIGRAHGLRGEVGIDVHTDVPAERLAVGQRLRTNAGTELVVSSVRVANDRWLIGFEGVPDRTAAEALRGLELLVDADTSDEDDAWYPHELEGLRAELVDGTVVGTVLGIEHPPAHDVLVVRETTGERTLVPFVAAIVPVVDVAGGRVVLDPPGGLLASDAENLVVSEETVSRDASSAEES